jgi:hypothetical protein
LRRYQVTKHAENFRGCKNFKKIEGHIKDFGVMNKPHTVVEAIISL